MKHLTLIRHGDAEPYGPGGDATRRLSASGEVEAARLGLLLGAMEGAPDLLLHSPAIRAAETARQLAASAAWQVEARQEASIYEASASLLLALVQTLPEAADRVVIVGHQPGIGQLSSALLGGASLNVTTGCGIGLAFAIERWREVKPGTAWLLWMAPAALSSALVVKK